MALDSSSQRQRWTATMVNPKLLSWRVSLPQSIWSARRPRVCRPNPVDDPMSVATIPSAPSMPVLAASMFPAAMAATKE